ncbi:hypothetical protein PR048_002848 [Dryococelus australis]|uniref:DUF4817 domain-containing protein n=1 Tax=Dryococelus australis TaxID=614101 RepID=A0ABQ9IMF0_9NEOP|nr:hypothetical protein PR048_002848 [Dryococelus australis]
MVFIYGEYQSSIRTAVRLYDERYPNRATPARSVFANIIKTFQETGSIEKKRRQRRKTVTDEGNAIYNLAAVAHIPNVITRNLELESLISQRNILRILHSNKFHPFHISLHQQLYGNYFRHWVQFSE